MALSQIYLMAGMVTILSTVGVLPHTTLLMAAVAMTF